MNLLLRNRPNARRADMQYSLRVLFAVMAIAAMIAAFSRERPEPKKRPFIRVSKMIVNDEKFLSYEVHFSSGTIEKYADNVSAGPELNEIIISSAPNLRYFQNEADVELYFNVPPSRWISAEMVAVFEHLKAFVATKADVDALPWLDVHLILGSRGKEAEVIVPLDDDFESCLPAGGRPGAGHRMNLRRGPSIEQVAALVIWMLQAGRIRQVRTLAAVREGASGQGSGARCRSEDAARW
jgi:hypothetical protein